MKRLSESTGQLLRTLYEERGFLSKLVGGEGPPLSVFSEIARTGEALAIPHLTNFLLHSSPDVQAAAARAIGQLVQTLLPIDIVQLDEACRNDWSYQTVDSSSWRNLKPSAMKSLHRLPFPVAVLGVASLHSSGFIREAAVQELSAVEDGSELPFMLVRLNDWVGPVREVAAAAVSRRVRPDYAKHFFENLRLVVRLNECGRGRHEQLVVVVLNLLRKPAATELLHEGIASTDRWLRRESFRIATEAKSPETIALLKNILVDRDPIMRLWAARTLLPLLGDDDLHTLLPVLRRDRFMPVRCEALSMLARRFPSEATGPIQEALLDAHSSVRALARYFLREWNPGYDFAGTYRQALHADSPARQRAAVLGLGENGESSDAVTLSEFLTSPLISLRKAAIRSISALDGDRQTGQFLTALADQHPGGSREAKHALEKRVTLVDDGLLLSLYRSDAPLHVRTNLFALLLHLPFWQRGIVLFEALRDREPHIVELARQEMRFWIMRSGSMALPPSSVQVKELRDAMKASAGTLSSHELGELKFGLRTYA